MLVSQVGIVGGGIGGLALAIALLNKGIDCTVFERDKSFGERSQGYGLTMQQVFTYECLHDESNTRIVVERNTEATP